MIAPREADDELHAAAIDGACVAGGPIDRRGFLRLSAATTLALSTAGAIAMSGCSAAELELLADYRPMALTLREFAILSAFCATAVSAKPGTPTAADTAIAKRVDKELTFHPDSAVLADVKNALLLIEYLPLASGYWRRFSRLAPAARETFLVAMSRSDISIRRDPVNGLRFMAQFFHYTDERTWRQIGYAGPTMDRKLPEAHNLVESA
ncbi:MAG: hypothetical protein HY699_19065 [Deltaproteobacteria bacterium]|nr:hypothetical protein [Deltaproteobacteria bacterium]